MIPLWYQIEDSLPRSNLLEPEMSQWISRTNASIACHRSHFMSCRSKFPVVRQSIDSLGLDSLDRGYSTDGFVERSDSAYSGSFRASHEVSVGKIKPFAFVEGNRSQE